MIPFAPSREQYRPECGYPSMRKGRASIEARGKILSAMIFSRVQLAIQLSKSSDPSANGNLPMAGVYNSVVEVENKSFVSHN